MIKASAPNKMHFTGEHSVVYGGYALVAPVEVGGKRNTIALEEHNSEFRFDGDIGSSWFENGEKKGDDIYKPMLDIASFVSEKMGKTVPKLKAALEWADAPKGTGNSACLSVCLAYALYKFFGKEPTREELYGAGFVGDNAYHGGKSSGGDVTAVLSDKIQKFRRVFTVEGVKPESQEIELQLPKDTALVLVSSHRGGAWATTSALIEQFAKAHNVSKKPAEMTDAERKKVYAPFDSVVEKIQSLCTEDASAEALGKAMDENHALLESVSTPDIDGAIGLAKDAGGALGGKLIGAGGAGGSLIVLAWTKDVESIRAKLKEKRFNSWPVQFASRGPSVD
ncbi:hypothetical protein HZC09_01310 [Candidatus Micrarchaeota archaeon]|nr:hypothetical protein [Candidatus Micrarchaeota archaeon]